MYLSILVAFHVLNVFISRLWIDRNTMTIFELCSGLLYRNLFYLRLVCAVFEKDIAAIGISSVFGSKP